MEYTFKSNILIKKTLQISLLIICFILLFNFTGCKKDNQAISDVPVPLSTATIQMKTLFDLTDDKHKSPLDGSKYTLKMFYPSEWEWDGSSVFTSNSGLAMVTHLTVRKINSIELLNKDAYKLTARDESYDYKDAKMIAHKTNNDVQYIHYRYDGSDGYAGEIVLLFDNSILIKINISEEINKSTFEAMINSVKLEYNDE